MDGISGQAIKNIIAKHNVSLSDIGRPIGMVRQNVNSKLNANDVGFGFVVYISGVTNIPLQEFVDEYLRLKGESGVNDPDEIYHVAPPKTVLNVLKSKVLHLTQYVYSIVDVDKVTAELTSKTNEVYQAFDEAEANENTKRNDTKKQKPSKK